MPRIENEILPGRLSSMNGYSRTAASWTKRSTADGVSFAFCSQRMRRGYASRASGRGGLTAAPRLDAWSR